MYRRLIQYVFHMYINVVKSHGRFGNNSSVERHGRVQGSKEVVQRRSERMCCRKLNIQEERAGGEPYWSSQGP